MIEIGIEHYSFGLEAWSIVTVGEWSKLELNRQSSLSMLHSFMVIQNRTLIILILASRPLCSLGLKKSFKELCRNGEEGTLLHKPAFKSRDPSIHRFIKYRTQKNGSICNI